MFRTDCSARAVDMGTVVQYHSCSTVNDTIHLGDGSMIQCSTTREVRVTVSSPYHRCHRGGRAASSAAAMVASRPRQPQQEGVPSEWCWCEIQGESGVTIDLDPDSDSDSEDAKSNRGGHGCGNAASLPITNFFAEDDDAGYMKNSPERDDQDESGLDCENSLVIPETMTMALSSERHATHHPDSQSTIHVQDEVLDSIASCLIASVSPNMEDEEIHCHPPACLSQLSTEPILSSKTEVEAQEEAPRHSPACTSQRSPQKTLRANWSCMWTPWWLLMCSYRCSVDWEL